MHRGRLGADEQLRGDLAVGASGTDEREHLALAGREDGGRLRGGPGTELIEQRASAELAGDGACLRGELTRLGLPPGRLEHRGQARGRASLLVRLPQLVERLIDAAPSLLHLVGGDGIDTGDPAQARQLGMDTVVPRPTLQSEGRPLCGNLVDLRGEGNRALDCVEVLGRTAPRRGGGVLGDQEGGHAETPWGEGGVPPTAQDVDERIVRLGGRLDVAGVALQVDHGSAAVDRERDVAVPLQAQSLDVAGLLWFRLVPP